MTEWSHLLLVIHVWYVFIESTDSRVKPISSWLFLQQPRQTQERQEGTRPDLLEKNVANIVGQWSVNLTIGYPGAGLQLMLGSCALRLWKVLMPFYHVKRWNRQEMMIFSWIYMKIRRLPWCSANFLVSFWKSETSFLENFDFFFFLVGATQTPTVLQ